MVLYADAALPTYVISEFLIIQGGSLNLFLMPQCLER